MLQDWEKKAFKIFLENNNATEDFENNLSAESDQEIDKYLENEYLSGINVLSSAFDYFRAHWPKEKPGINAKNYWMQLNMKWRSFLVETQHYGLPFVNEETL